MSQQDDDLFALPTPGTNQSDPRVRAMRMVEEAPTGPVRISDPQQMIDLFTEHITKDMPTAAQIAEYKAKGHRYRVEEGEFDITGILGHVTAGLFKWMVHQSLEKTNEGSFLHTISREQYNGVWVPTACAIRRAQVPKMNMRREVKRGLPPDAAPLDDAPIFEPVGVATAILQYRIVWTDAAGNKDIRYDLNGKPITDTNVAVTNTTDPALVAILTQQAENMRMMLEQARGAPATPAADVVQPSSDDADQKRAEHARLVREGKERAAAARGDAKDSKTGE